MGSFVARAPKPKPAGDRLTASVDDEPTKVCPNCGAEIRRAAQLCYCYYSFEPRPQPAPTTRPPARVPSQSTGHLGRIVLFGLLALIVTITLVLVRNELTCGRHNCNVPAQSAAPGGE
jgi:hypothetical protein